MITEQSNAEDGGQRVAISSFVQMDILLFCNIPKTSLH